MILIDGITEADRRASIRELADVSDQIYTDDRLDRKIAEADAMAQTRLQSTEPTRNMVTVSNLITAKLISIGIGNEENNARITEINQTTEKIIESENNKAPEQDEPIVSFSGGHDGISYDRYTWQ